MSSTMTVTSLHQSFFNCFFVFFASQQTTALFFPFDTHRSDKADVIECIFKSVAFLKLTWIPLCKFNFNLFTPEMQDCGNENLAPNKLNDLMQTPISSDVSFQSGVEQWKSRHFALIESCKWFEGLLLPIEIWFIC